jgi:hypothetical protein
MMHPQLKLSLNNCSVSVPQGVPLLRDLLRIQEEYQTHGWVPLRYIPELLGDQTKTVDAGISTEAGPEERAWSELARKSQEAWARENPY